MGNAAGYNREPVPSCIPSRNTRNQEGLLEPEDHEEPPKEDEPIGEKSEDPAKSEIDLEIDRITQAVQAGEVLLQRLKAQKLEMSQIESVKPTE